MITELKKDGLVDSRGCLTVLGIWRLSQTILNFCDENRYPLWRFFYFEKHEESAIHAWCDAFTSALADWAEVSLWQVKWPDEWPDADKITVYLSEEEYEAGKFRGIAPLRHVWTLEILDDDVIETGVSKNEPPTKEKLRLGDLVQSRYGIDALIYRLDRKCVAPYDAVEIPFLEDETALNRKVWTWASDPQHPLALAWPDLSGFQVDNSILPPVLLPRKWGTMAKCCGFFGPMLLQGGNSIVVMDQTGRSGVIMLINVHDALLGDVVGYWLQPCVWNYLQSKSAVHPVYEAAQSLVPDAGGEVVCDIINVAEGNRLNPDGVKVLANTFDDEVCIAINEARDADTPKRVDLMNVAGRLIHRQTDKKWTASDLRWSDIRDAWEDYWSVKCPTTGLWGFISDKTGEVVIKPQFFSPTCFSDGTAGARPVDAPEKMGLINKEGKWVVHPAWRSVKTGRDGYFVVQNDDDCWGAIDGRGKIVIELRSRASWLQDAGYENVPMKPTRKMPWSKSKEQNEEDVVLDCIAGVYHERLRPWVRAACLTPPYTLASLEGIFKRNTTETMLRNAGVWGLPIRVLQDKTTGILDVKAGETGRIGTFYPVGLSCFDLSLEAPVYGLASHPETIIGILWKNLEVIHHG